MAIEGDLSQFNDLLEPSRRVINTEPSKDQLSSATKLNCPDSNQSLKEGLPNLLSLDKRKRIIDMNDVCTPEKRIKTDSSSTLAASPSLCEAKRLKIDLIATKAQITHLESRINHQQTIRNEMQILSKMEKDTLMEQHKKDERALSDMEDRLQVIQRREEELKDVYYEAVKHHKENKAHWDREKAELQKQIADLRDKLLECNVSSKAQLSEMKKDMSELLQALEGAQSEVEMLKAEVAKHTSMSEQYITLRNQLEKQNFELQSVTNKLKALEYERDSYKDWQQQTKTAHKRLTNMAELEKEVSRLRAQERSLRDSACNKLLLEEQVHLLQSRVDALQPVQNELHEAKVELASLKSQLEEWKTAARTHGVENARTLSNALNSALNSEFNATAASTQAQSQLTQFTEEVASLKFERDKATGKLNELVIIQKNQKSLIHRLQKRLLLVTRERDSYRQQLDCYEKELTVTLCGKTGAGSEALLSARVDELEKALQGYRDLLATHDQTAHIKLVESLRVESSKWREEAEMLRRDVTKLRAQRDTLHADLERIGAHAQNNVLHLNYNPASEAQERIQAELKDAQEEIKRLKAALRDGGSSRACPEELQQLRQKLETGSSHIEFKEYQTCTQNPPRNT